MKKITRITCQWILILSSLFVLSACSTTSQQLKYTPKENNQAAELNAKLGLAYIGLHDNARAKQKILRAQQEAPHNPVVWYTQGYFQEQTGDISLAEKSYIHAITIAPGNGAAHNNYGAFLCRQGKYLQAIQQFLAAIKDPHYLHVAHAYENAGSCAMKIPDRALAKKLFQRAVGADSTLEYSAMQLKHLQGAVS